MRSLVPILLALDLLLAGGSCARRKPAGALAARPGATPARTPRVIITPENISAGKVVQVNVPGRFVVLAYPMGQVPPVGLRLDLYRRGLKVAEVRVSDPQTDESTVADILSGDAESGDEARRQ